MARRLYTKIEDDYIKEHANLPIEELARRLGRSVGSTSNRRFKLCVRTSRKPNARYSHANDVYIMEHIKDSNEEIGEALGRTAESIKYRKRKLGYK